MQFFCFFLYYPYLLRATDYEVHKEFLFLYLILIDRIIVLFLDQGCFRRNVTVVTIYASLGEEALCHSLNEVCLCLPQLNSKFSVLEIAIPEIIDLV
jgi:hypothetical protein